MIKLAQKILGTCCCGYLKTFLASSSFQAQSQKPKPIIISSRHPAAKEETIEKAAATASFSLVASFNIETTGLTQKTSQICKTHPCQATNTTHYVWQPRQLDLTGFDVESKTVRFRRHAGSGDYRHKSSHKARKCRQASRNCKRTP